MFEYTSDHLKRLLAQYRERKIRIAPDIRRQLRDLHKKCAQEFREKHSHGSFCLGRFRLDIPPLDECLWFAYVWDAEYVERVENGGCKLRNKERVESYAQYMGVRPEFLVALRTAVGIHANPDRTRSGPARGRLRKVASVRLAIADGTSRS
jgi:hypothetical protein